MTIPQRPFTADEVKAKIAKLLSDWPELCDDDEALLLSLASETEATELCSALVRRIKENEAHSNGTAAYIAELKGRIEMFDRRDIAMRALLLTIMQAAGINKLPLPIATVSASPSRHLVVVDREKIPGRFRRYPEWEPMKNDIKTALKAGQDVPGCTLSNAEMHVTIRLK